MLYKVHLNRQIQAKNNVSTTPNKKRRPLKMLKKITLMLFGKINKFKILNLASANIVGKGFNSFMPEVPIIFCKANQWTGFHMIGTSVMRELNP